MITSNQKVLFTLATQPLASKDQHFCTDEALLDLMVKTARVNQSDTILEIGAGTGNLTVKLADAARKVIAIENDSRFELALSKLKGNTEIIIGNALPVLPPRKDFNKIVASIPYQICEPLLHFLCTANQMELAVLLVPKKFAGIILKHPISSAFLEVTRISEVAKNAFIPPPKVLSEIILITSRADPDDSQFIRQKLYLQRDKKVKNGLRDGLIDLYRKKHDQQLTKKQAVELADSLELPDKLVAQPIARIHSREYEVIGNKVKLMKI